MSGIDSSQFQDSYFALNGKAAEAPPLERIPLGDIEGMMYADDLWESFFKTYLPEANDEWETPERAQELENEGILTVKARYQSTFNIYVAKFKNEYLDLSPNETIVINGQTININQASYGGGNSDTRIAMWNQYLANSDIVIRHKAVYLWSIIDLLVMMQALSDTVTNQANSSKLFHGAQRRNVGEMGKKSFQKMKKQTIPYDLIMDPGPVKHNGETSYQISILKAYADKIRSTSESRGSALMNSRNSYMDHNRAIGSFISQLESLIDEFTK